MKTAAEYGVKRVPKVGDIVYVRSSRYVYHGCDDFGGGRAHVSKVTEAISGGKPAVFIQIKERPGYGYNWKFLEVDQEWLKEQHGDDWAHPDPDYSPEFNCPNADWS